MTPATRPFLVPTRTLEVPDGCLTIRAEFVPESFQVNDGGNPTVRLIASAGAAVTRYGWFEGGPEEYDELLSFEQGAHRDERLNSGRVNLLLNHDRSDVREVIGVLSKPVWDRTAKTLELTARLSRRQEHAGLVQDIRDGILGSTSIGYRTFRTRDITTRDSERRQIESIDWETREVSLVSVPADAGSHVRNEPEQRGRTTIVVMPRTETEPMKPDATNPTASPAAPAPAAPAEGTRTAEPAAQPAAPVAPASSPASSPSPDALRAAADAELARQRGIRENLRRAGLETDGDFADGLLNDRGVSADAAASRILARLAASSSTTDGLVAVGAEAGGKLARQVEAAILFRTNQLHYLDGVRTGRGLEVDQAKVQAQLQGNPFLHRRLIEMGEGLLAQAFNVRGLERLSIRDRAASILRPRISDDLRAVGSSSPSHSTADFPGILANVVNKVLRGAYDLTPETYSQWTARGTLNDFKPGSRVQLGHAPRLLQVREGAEYTYGTFGEQAESIVLAKYGRVVGLTWEMMVNDDLDAFSRIPRQYGASAAQLVADLVYLHLTGNTVMADGLGIFHATHGNYVTGAGNSLASAGVTSLSNVRALAAVQTTIDEGRPDEAGFYMAVQLQHLRVPPQLQTAAEQLTTLIQAQTVGSVNPFQGEFRSVMAEPRLSGSALAYYLMADPSMADTIEVAFLAGESGPMVEQRMGFERDGVDVKVRMTVGTAPTDFRGLYKNDGTV